MKLASCKRQVCSNWFSDSYSAVRELLCFLILIQANLERINFIENFKGYDCQDQKTGSRILLNNGPKPTQKSQQNDAFIMPFRTTTNLNYQQLNSCFKPISNPFCSTFYNWTENIPASQRFFKGQRVLKYQLVVFQPVLQLTKQFVSSMNANNCSPSSTPLYGFLCQTTNVFYAFETYEQYQEFLGWLQQDSPSSANRSDATIASQEGLKHNFDMATDKIMEVFTDAIFSGEHPIMELEQADF